MKKYIFYSGFTLIEVLVSVGVFMIFALGVYSCAQLAFKLVSYSRVRILETEVLTEELEAARTISYNSVGVKNGFPAGVLEGVKTITRNGMTFSVVTTVRNVDDPFDGTVTGTPHDSAPADYKLVEMQITCSSCSQQNIVAMSTRIAPKLLETATNNGSLFLTVFGANGLPVSGANVTVSNPSSVPPIVINDVTDSQGNLNLIDVPTGTLAYSVLVNKIGYASDYTVSASVQNPNPSRPPATVASQNVTQLSFEIDRLGSLFLHILKESCVPQTSFPFSVHGAKLIGSNPTVYKFNQAYTSDAVGAVMLPHMEEDGYTVSASGSPYDVMGTIPQSPLRVDPGVAQEATVILKNHTANSLLVRVKDAGTGLPLAGANVNLLNGGYNKVLGTDLGYVRQTDWSGGGGQVDMVNDTQYFVDDFGVSNFFPAGDLKLRRILGSPRGSPTHYLSSGWLESSTFDLGSGVTYRNIIWEPTAQPIQTGATPLLFQIASSNSSTPSSWNFLGPDGSTTTYYSVSNSVMYPGHNGNRYLRYRVFLSTEDIFFTPQLSELSFTYSNSCTPPGQVFFSGLSEGTFTLIVTSSGYLTESESVDVHGNNETTVNMSKN